MPISNADRLKIEAIGAIIDERCALNLTWTAKQAEANAAIEAIRADAAEWVCTKCRETLAYAVNLPEPPKCKTVVDGVPCDGSAEVVGAIPKVLFGGSMGGGKSYWGCQRGIEASEKHPGSRGYMCRKEAVTFNKTTLITLMDPHPVGLDVLNRPGWTHAISKQYFLHENGSRIDYGGLSTGEDINKVKSMLLSWAFIDEASDVPSKSAHMLESRVGRIAQVAGTEWVGYASNPEPCWLEPDFVNAHKDRARVFIQSLPTDNEYLQPSYIPNLRKTWADTPEYIEAYLYGNWGAVGLGDAVFTPTVIDVAMKREGDAVRGTDKPIEWGVDVARFGEDKTVVYSRHGLTATRMAKWHRQDTRETSDKLMAVYKALPTSLRPSAIKVDDIGVGGAVTDNLRAAGLPVMPVDVGRTATESDKFANRKAEITWHLRKVLEDGGTKLPQDEMLRTEMTSIKWKVKSGRIAIESKDDIKERIGHSPDDADALILCFATDPKPLFGTFDKPEGW